MSTPFSAFGIFDGHGGKSSATVVSKELLPTVTRLLDRCKTAGVCVLHGLSAGAGRKRAGCTVATGGAVADSALQCSAYGLIKCLATAVPVVHAGCAQSPVLSCVDTMHLELPGSAAC